MERTLFHKKLRAARRNAGLTQDALADRLHVSARLIRQIEHGEKDDLGIKLSCSWLEACDVSPLPTFREYLCPEVYEGVSAASAVDDIRAALCEYFTNEAGEWELRELYYAINGGHGSAWPSVLNMLTMALHCPLPDRRGIEELIREDYQRAQRMGKVVCPRQALPQLDAETRK